ncbi:MAG: ABC transporter substrate-binding protein/permease [Pirellulales bacterium]
MARASRNPACATGVSSIGAAISSWLTLAAQILLGWNSRWIPWVVASVVASVLASLPAARLAAQPSETAPLHWAADAEGGAPYLFKDPDDPNRNLGFEVDLTKAIAEQLKRPIEFHQYNYDSLVSGLERRDFDFAMNGLEVTPDRAKRLRFSRPYYVYHLQLVTRKDDARIKSLADCQTLNATVGTLGETAASRLLERMGIESKFYDGQAEPYQNLVLGRIDAVLMDLPIALYYARPNPKLQFVGQPLERGHYAVAFRKDQESLAKQFDQAILTLAREGKLKEIYEKWQLWTPDQESLSADDPYQATNDTESGSAASAGMGAGPAAGNILAETSERLTFRRYFPLLCYSALVTIEVSTCSMALAMFLGLFIALARLYGPPPLRWLAISYVEFFRGIPVLLLLYLLYYAIPSLLEQAQWGISFKPSDFTVAILAFGLNYAAYEAEIYRGGLSSIPAGQWEAAASLGMSRVTTFRRVILPQALRVITPPVTNDFVALFKDTSLVSTIGIIELTKQYQMLSKSSLKYLEIGLATAALYLLMSVPLGYLARQLEKRWATH